MHQRLIFYFEGMNGDIEDYNDHEIQIISEFKVWCKANQVKIPDIDEEILRNLYARKFDCK